jgi:hypothetical protein
MITRGKEIFTVHVGGRAGLLDVLGIESRWGRDFPHLSRPALGPTQPPGGKERPGREADTSPPSSAVVMKG